MARTPRSQRIITGFLIISGLAAFLYVSVSITVALVIAYRPPKPITRTPASLGLVYRDVTFLSREDHLLLRGWLIPGILPDGRLPVERTVIQVHGANSNRAMVLDKDALIARQGIAILAFDSRGNGESAIKAIVVDSPYATLGEYMERAFGPYLIFIPGTRFTSMMLSGIDYGSVRPVDVIAKIAPRPIFLIQIEVRRSIWYILFIALAPLYLLAIMGAIVLALVMLNRDLISPSNFLFQQKIFILIMILGVISAIIVYAISVIYALKKIGVLRQIGHTRQANGGLIVLAMVASVMILPVILALFFH